LGEDHLWHGVAQGVRVARRQHGIERPEQPEPDPIMEEAEEVKEAEEEIVATPTLNDVPEGEEPGRLR
jgi:hypothetical protein